MKEQYTIKGVIRYLEKPPVWCFNGKINGNPWDIRHETKRGLLKGITGALEVELGLRQTIGPVAAEDDFSDQSDS